MPTVDRDKLREGLAEAFERRFPLTRWQAEAHAAALLAGPLSDLLAQADTAAQAVADRDKIREELLAFGELYDREDKRVDAEIKGLEVANARLSAEVERLRADADRFRALMRCGRIKVQGSAGLDPDTGALKYPVPGSVHFGAEFWPLKDGEPDRITKWGRHCIRALADDILRVEAARTALAAGQDKEGGTPPDPSTDAPAAAQERSAPNTQAPER